MSNDIPIKVASPLNYPNPCYKFEDKETQLTRKTYLVSYVNQNNSELRKHTDPLTSHFGEVNNAASTSNPYEFYGGIAGGCIGSNNPDSDPLGGGTWDNQCHKNLDLSDDFDLSPFIHNSPGQKAFDKEQIAFLKSLNELIPDLINYISVTHNFVNIIIIGIMYQLLMILRKL